MLLENIKMAPDMQLKTDSSRQWRDKFSRSGYLQFSLIVTESFEANKQHNQSRRNCNAIKQISGSGLAGTLFCYMKSRGWLLSSP